MGIWRNVGVDVLRVPSCVVLSANRESASDREGVATLRVTLELSNELMLLVSEEKLVTVKHANNINIKHACVFNKQSDCYRKFKSSLWSEKWVGKDKMLVGQKSMQL